MSLREAFAIHRDYCRISAEHKAQRVKYWAERFAAPVAPVKSVKPGALDRVHLPVTPSPSSDQPRYRGELELLCKDCGLPTCRDKQAVRCKLCAAKHKRATMRDRWREKCKSPFVVDAAALRDALKAKRRELGVSQCRAADMAGVSHTFVRFVEAGRQEPRKTTLRKLCAWLGVAPDAFLRRAA